MAWNGYIHCYIFTQRLHLTTSCQISPMIKAIMGVVALGFLLSFRAIFGAYIRRIYGEAGQRLNVRIVSSFRARI